MFSYNRIEDWFIDVTTFSTVKLKCSMRLGEALGVKYNDSRSMLTELN